MMKGSKSGENGRVPTWITCARGVIAMIVCAQGVLAKEFPQRRATGAVSPVDTDSLWSSAEVSVKLEKPQTETNGEIQVYNGSMKEDMDVNALFFGTFNYKDQARQLKGERIEGPELE
ncbi:MAG: hypothetical protein ABR915_03260 [Thermoguttaceae bacterium]|jgi:hypothetical protein